MPETVRIFVGTEPKTRVAEQVLAFSIRRRTQAVVEIVPMIDHPHWEYPAGLPVGTGFSLRRWLIPSWCNWEGKAIYMDADQLVFGDVLDLWNKKGAILQLGQSAGKSTSSGLPSTYMTYQPDKFSKSPWPQSSVMLIDCAIAKRDLDNMGAFGWDKDQMIAAMRKYDRKAYIDFMHGTWLKTRPGMLPVEWNHLNVYTAKTKLLHFTSEPDQCWYKPQHPLSSLWQTELELAIKAGAVDKAMFEDALSKWGVKEDWRNQNGLHPFYARYLPLFPS